MSNFKNKLEKAAEKFAGQVVTVASDCVQGAADFIESKSTLCEAKIALTALREKRDNLLQELGSFAYFGSAGIERVEEEIRMELDSVCAEIAEYEKICNVTTNEPEETTDNNSSTVFCGECGVKNPANKAYCKNCGASLKD